MTIDILIDLVGWWFDMDILTAMQTPYNFRHFNCFTMIDKVGGFGWFKDGYLKHYNESDIQKGLDLFIDKFKIIDNVRDLRNRDVVIFDNTHAGLIYIEDGVIRVLHIEKGWNGARFEDMLILQQKYKTLRFLRWLD